MAALPLLNAFALEPDGPFEDDALDEVLATGMLTADQLEEFADGLAPELVVVHRWRPETDTDAEWAMERLGQIEAQRKHLKDQADEWVAKTRHALAESLKKLDPRKAYYEGILADYGIRCRLANASVIKVNLPSGVIATRAATKPTVEIVDDDEVAQWAAEALDAKRYDLVVKVTYEPHISELRKLVAIVARYACEQCGETEFSDDEKAQGWHTMPEDGAVEGEDPHPVQCGPVVEHGASVVLRPLDDEESAPVVVPGVQVVAAQVTASVKPNAI